MMDRSLYNLKVQIVTLGPSNGLRGNFIAIFPNIPCS